MWHMHYIGEHLFPGILGQTFIWISFFTALSSSLFYLIALIRKKSGSGILIIGRSFYSFHFLTLIGAGVLLYFIIFRHYFEYAYVWQYSSKELDIKYIISCFWAGQEGSFLVWAFWQSLIGMFLIALTKEWESPVMLVFSLSQAFVTSMLLGVELFGLKIGLSPFTLLRETVPTINGTIFQETNYITLLKDGNGLNPLLENVWMTIHPPILFLGYALCLVPFSYAMAGLITKDYQNWIRRAYPWTLLALIFLGSGILLGGAWAYVSLTFGGFWAWDPVENSSLVPSMTLLATLHFFFIYRKQNFGLLMAFLFATLTYILVLYAGFLTRSGVLANTSAHSFGSNGMTGQLMIFLLTFLALMIFWIIIRYRDFHKRIQDRFHSREFWMFIGSLVIILAAFQIIFTTSIPVINLLFKTNLAPPVEPVTFYNRWQTPFVLLIAAFIAFTQFLNYSYNTLKDFFRKLFIPFTAALLTTLPFVLTGITKGIPHISLLFLILFALYSVLTNGFFTTSKPANPGAILAHAGFLTFLLGILLTFSNSRTISTNTSRFDLGDAKTNAQHLVLMKHDTLFMGGYYVAYMHDKKMGNTTEYQVDFMTYKDDKFSKAFSLHPSVNIHPRMGAVYNPSTRHFIWRDYYTYIVQANSDPDYIVIKVVINPYINILWMGAIIMTAGFIFSYYRKIRRPSPGQ